MQNEFWNLRIKGEIKFKSGRILLVEDQDDMLIIIIKNDNDISIMWH